MRSFITYAVLGASLLGLTTASPIAPRNDYPSPTKGFFPNSKFDKHMYGKLNVIRDGKKDGCWAKWGDWTRDDTACGEYMVKWDTPKNKVSFRLIAAEEYPVTYNYDEENAGRIYTSNYIPGTKFYASKTKLAAPPNKWSQTTTPLWSTKFYAKEEPSGDETVDIWTTEQAIAFTVEWESS